MGTYLLLLATMFLGAVLFIWFRAVWQVGWNRMDAVVFYQENRTRFVLCLVGVLLISLIYTLDETGLIELLQKQGLGLFTASKLSIGFGVGGVSLIARKSKVENE
jgi:hypothetical protein